MKKIMTLYQVGKHNDTFEIEHPVTKNKIIGGFEQCIAIISLEVGIPVSELIEGLIEHEIEQKRLKALRDDGYY